jgi:Bacteriocin class II with double-glycine leader peptide
MNAGLKETTMSNTNNNSKLDHRELTDTELDAVTGGNAVGGAVAGALTGAATGCAKAKGSGSGSWFEALGQSLGQLMDSHSQL